MKVLFITPHYKPYFGGIERVIEQLSNQFTANFNIDSCLVLTSKWSFSRKYHPKWLKREKIDNEEVIRLSSFPPFAPPFFQVPLVWFSPWEIIRILSEVKPDVIQLMSDRWFWVNFWVIYWARKNKIPVFFSLSFHKLTPAQQWLRPLNALITRLATKVVVITEHEKKLVKQAYKTPESQFAIVPWGVNLTNANNFPEKPSNPNESAIQQTTLLAVGRISRHKGQKWLADIYKQAAIKGFSELILVGEVEDANEQQQIEDIELSANKKISLTGHVTEEQLNKYYQRADLFVLFPEYEAFGLVYLEAMEQGLAVLTHKVGAVEEVLQDNAIVIDKYSQMQAISQLEELVNNADKRQQLAAKGQQYARSNFSWNNAAHAFIRIYQSAA